MMKNNYYIMQPWMAWQKHNEIFYLCDLRDETLFLMSDISYEIIQYIIGEKKNIEQTIEKISNRYPGNEDIIRSDVNEFLSELEKIDVIRNVKSDERD